MTDAEMLSYYRRLADVRFSPLNDVLLDEIRRLTREAERDRADRGVGDVVSEVRPTWPDVDVALYAGRIVAERDALRAEVERMRPVYLLAKQVVRHDLPWEYGALLERVERLEVAVADFETKEPR